MAQFQQFCTCFLCCCLKCRIFKSRLFLVVFRATHCSVDFDLPCILGLDSHLSSDNSRFLRPPTWCLRSVDDRAFASLASQLVSLDTYFMSLPIFNKSET